MARNTENTLIILDYLLKFTDNEHMSSAKDINTYSEETYGVTIDRRSIKELLEELKYLNEKYPNNFPFTIKSDGGKRPKYYIEKRGFSKVETLAIASAINNDPYTPIEVAEKLVELLLKDACSDFEYPEMLDTINNGNKKVGKISIQVAATIKKIEKAIKEKRQITYKHIYPDSDKTETHYFYKVIYVGDRVYGVCIDNGKLKSLLLDHLQIVSIGESWYDDPRCKFEISDEYTGNYDSPDEEIKKSVMPGGYDTVVIQFNFPNIPYSIMEVSRSFKNFFHKDIVYKVHNDRCYSAVRCNEQTFIKWCFNIDIARFIRIASPESTRMLLWLNHEGVLHDNRLDHYKISSEGVIEVIKK